MLNRGNLFLVAFLLNSLLGVDFATCANTPSDQEIAGQEDEQVQQIDQKSGDVIDYADDQEDEVSNDDDSKEKKDASKNNKSKQAKKEAAKPKPHSAGDVISAVATIAAPVIVGCILGGIKFNIIQEANKSKLRVIIVDKNVGKDRIHGLLRQALISKGFYLLQNTQINNGILTSYLLYHPNYNAVSYEMTHDPNFNATVTGVADIMGAFTRGSVYLICECDTASIADNLEGLKAELLGQAFTAHILAESINIKVNMIQSTPVENNYSLNQSTLICNRVASVIRWTGSANVLSEAQLINSLA